MEQKIYVGMISCGSLIILSYIINRVALDGEGIIKSTMASFMLSYLLGSGGIFNHMRDPEISVMIFGVLLIVAFIAWLIAVLAESSSQNIRLIEIRSSYSGPVGDIIYSLIGLFTPKLTSLFWVGV